MAKNPEIFEKAQSANKSKDWYSLLQESKSALLRTVVPKSLSPNKEEMSESAFDLMLTAKKELKKHVQLNGTMSSLNSHKPFKLSKEE